MEEQSRRRPRGDGGEHIGRGGRGQSRGQGRGRGRGRGEGRIYNNWSGRGRPMTIGEAVGAVGFPNWQQKYKGFGKRHQNEKKSTLEIPEDEIDPLKLYVGNLRPYVNKDQLLAALTPHAKITSAYIIKKISKGPNYGFVSLPTEVDVKKIMDLNNQGCYLSGSKLKFRPARKRYMPPGEEGFVRQSLPDRDYDLSPLDPDKPYIHVLVDDVMMKILEYLPLKERILCEVVCRRWQALLYIIFESTHLNLSNEYLIQNRLYVSKAMVSKMLLLTGETLKSFSLFGTDYTLKKKLFLIIAQLCPNLEYLDLSNDIYFDNIKALKDCNKLKSFSAKRCFHLNENSLKELISVLPCLEKIDVSHSTINGRCFNLLPEGLKELNISFCSEVSEENLRKISKTCKNLEVLEVEKLFADKQFLEELGVNCTNLKSLKVYVPSIFDVSNQIKVFTKLTCLKIITCTLDFHNIVDNVKDLEELHIQILRPETTNMVDFGKFTQLKKVSIITSPFHKQELMSLEKCKNLQYVTIEACDNADQEIIKNIVKGCPEIKHINCPTKVGIDMRLLDDLFHIMKNRSEPIKITINEGALDREWLKSHYETMKIDFVFGEYSLFDEDSDCDIDDLEDNFYDSDDIDHFWLNGYDSDNSLPDYMYFGDGLDFLHHFVFECGLHHVGYDSDGSC